MQRVVVTGFGCISAAGHDNKSFEQALFATEANQHQTIKPISLFTPDKDQCQIAAEVKNYRALDYFNKSELKQLDRFAQFALISADEAMTQANLKQHAFNKQRAAIIHGTSIGGQQTIESSYQQLYCTDNTRAHPFTVPKLLPSSASSQIAMKYGLQGPAFTTSSACSSAGHAIAMACLLLRNNMVDIAITGGAEACITAGNFQAWHGLRVLSNDTCRPFCETRSGLVIGEGSATLVLETLEHALARSAPIYAELVGVGMSSDAHNLVQPLAEGAQLAMMAALSDANINERQIDYINAHGSGTKQNDKTETQAIKAIFDDHADKLSISSTKSMHGHMLGAGGASESIAAILAIQQQMVPPTRNYVLADMDCDLNYVPNNPINREVSYALTNSFAFGGLNTSLIFKQFDQ